MRLQSYDADWGYWGQDASVMCEGQLAPWQQQDCDCRLARALEGCKAWNPQIFSISTFAALATDVFVPGLGCVRGYNVNQ